jgi:hypothetical protein
MPQSKMLALVPPALAVTSFQGFIECIRIKLIIRGRMKLKIWLLYNRIAKLQWDHGWMKWSNNKPFMSYTTPMGRDLLCKRLPVPSVIQRKWLGVLPPTFILG